MELPKKTSPHILNTSANLLGFCLFVITSLHITDKSATTLIDEFTSVIALLLTLSTIFSFVSIQSKVIKKEKAFERIADNLFLISLIGIFVIIVYMIIYYWKK